MRNKKESSLATVIKKVKLNPTEGVDVIEFSEDDVVRHRLTTYFINLFKEEIK
jgi:phosphate starvation-inducible protein PhoH